MLFRSATMGSYLFRKAEGDCPSGCIENEYWYFEVTRDGIRYVGTWNGDSHAVPAWWPDAEINMLDFHHRWSESDS